MTAYNDVGEIFHDRFNRVEFAEGPSLPGMEPAGTLFNPVDGDYFTLSSSWRTPEELAEDIGEEEAFTSRPNMVQFAESLNPLGIEFAPTQFEPMDAYSFVPSNPRGALGELAEDIGEKPYPHHFRHLQNYHIDEHINTGSRSRRQLDESWAALSFSPVDLQVPHFIGQPADNALTFADITDVERSLNVTSRFPDGGYSDSTSFPDSCFGNSESDSLLNGLWITFPPLPTAGPQAPHSIGNLGDSLVTSSDSVAMELSSNLTPRFLNSGFRDSRYLDSTDFLNSCYVGCQCGSLLNELWIALPPYSTADPQASCPIDNTIDRPVGFPDGGFPDPADFSHYRSINADGTWRCAHPGCRSRKIFRRNCDFVKHFKNHIKSFSCSYPGCPQASKGSFATSKDRKRHENSHQPNVYCGWKGCERVFSRVDNMKDHVRRMHLGTSN